MDLEEKVIQVLESVSRKVIPSKGGVEIGAVCPFCGGSKENPDKIQFFFNLRRQVYYCFRCDTRGRGFLDLVSKLGLDPLYYVSEDELEVLLAGSPINLPLKEEKKRTGKARVWNIDRFCVRKHPEIDNFVERRLFGRRDERFEILYGIRGDGWVFRRIVFPVRDKDGFVRIFSARATRKGQEPKYIIPPVGTFDKGIPLMGYDLHGYVVVVEGAVDVLLGGPHFTCSFGTVNEGKVQWIKDQIPPGTEIILAPDADPPGIKACLGLLRKDPRYRVFIPPVGKDLGEWLEKDPTGLKLYKEGLLGDFIYSNALDPGYFLMVGNLFASR